ncbi:MAG: shikimate dehydrogenase [Candidatus Sumerlaeia bacterium]|nr:shikimate dehydrogenase [Candidatus Sumerlaeia bacterium]
MREKRTHKILPEIPIRGTTKLVGLIGYNIQYTLSPPMHNAMFKAMNLDYAYVPLPVAPPYLKQAIAGIKALNFCGVNVTIPYKEKVIPYLDHLADEASLIGAVNTIKIERDGTLTGYNTDAYGFLKSLKEELNFSLRGKNVIIIGAGGAGKAIAVCSVLKKARQLVLVDIIPQRLKKLANMLKSIAGDTRIVFYLANSNELITALQNAHLIVNATPLGMKETDNPPVDLTMLNPRVVVFDAIYTQRITVTMRAALAAGCKQVTNGIGMLVHQGARSFEIWTGKKPDTTLMRTVVEKFIFEK